MFSYCSYSIIGGGNLEEKISEGRVKIYPSDWRWSAAVVGLDKYFVYLKDTRYLDVDYIKEDEYIEFNESDITVENYLLFAENYFMEYMHHKRVENLIQEPDPSEEVIKLANDKLSKNTSSNTIMIKTFKKVKYDGQNANIIQDMIDKNRLELIKQTFKGGRALYYNFCNENALLSDKGNSCRIRGYSVDMGKKSKSVSYRRDKSTFVYQDSKYFDFIPFAFSKTREAFFINNNFTVDQLIRTNKNDWINDENAMKSQLLFKTRNSAKFIDYDVEIIKKDREKDYFETIYVREKAIKIFEEISEHTVEILARACNIKRSENSQNIWINVEHIVTNSILNHLKLDDFIESLFKAYNDHRYLISHLIGINQLIYEGGDKMTEKQNQALGAAMAVKQVLRGKENKLRAYEQRLISAITLKDYDRVQEILLHLSAFTQVRMDFLMDVFKDFEANKNLVYTFINVLGEKKRVENKGDGQS